MIRMLVLAAATALAAPPSHAPAAIANDLADHGWSAARLVELGDAYTAAHARGPAILAYERAHVLAPRDRTIDDDLAHAREAAGVTGPAPTAFERTLGVLDTDAWTGIALAAGVLGCLALALRPWTDRRRLRRAAGTTALAAAVIAASAAASALLLAPPADRAIVLTGTQARIAPLSTAEPAFDAAEGEGVRVERTRGDFVYVQDGDKAGWLPASDVERVLTRRSRSPA